MLPKNLKYGTKVESASARSSRVNIQPQTGTTFALNENIIFHIPTRANLCLVPTESYLKFALTVTSTVAANAFRWDSCGAHGLIQRIRVYHGSNLLQDIDNYGMLAKMLMDIQSPTDSQYGKNTILCGTRSDLVISTPTFTDAATAVTTFSNKNLPVYQINSGEVIRNESLALAVGNTEKTTTDTYCLNLISLVGSLSNHYIPLFAMTSSPLRLEIQLVDSINKGMNALKSAATISLTNVEYVANFIELSDSAMGIIANNLQGQPLQFTVPDYRNYQSAQAITAAATQISIPIPAKFSSLKSIFMTQRDQVNTIAYYPFSSVTLAIVDYQFRLGSQILPTKAVNSLPEMFAEVMKAIGSMSDINHQPSIDKNSYILAASVVNSTTLDSNFASNVSSGSFYIGLNLENYEGASKDTIFAGMNTNTDDIYAILNIGARAAATNIRWDAYALFDCLIVFENNTAYAKF